MLTSVELTNYRGHVHTTVPLSRFTLLVGDNAVGKTSVLEAVDLVSALFKPTPLHDVFKDAWDLRWLARWTSEAPCILLRSTSPDGELLVSPKLRNGSLAVDSHYVWRDALGNASRDSLSRLWNLPAVKIASLGLQPAMRMLAMPSVSNDSVPSLREDGFGLPTFIAYLRLKSFERYNRLVAALRTVVPDVVDLEFERLPQQRQVQRAVNLNGQIVPWNDTETYIADELRLKFADGAVLPAHAASEGTLMAIALLAAVHSSDPPDVVLLDDIDRGLHPRAQGELVRALRAAQETSPGTQIIATSHSPYLVDHFSPDEIVVLSRQDKTRDVIARRLSEHPDERLRKAMTAGEFLNASGWYWP
jgi:AAA domain, putative AbiEii toxin, Type IV TA system/AAA ATPase domain